MARAWRVGQFFWAEKCKQVSNNCSAIVDSRSRAPITNSISGKVNQYSHRTTRRPHGFSVELLAPLELFGSSLQLAAKLERG